MSSVTGGYWPRRSSGSVVTTTATCLSATDSLPTSHKWSGRTLLLIHQENSCCVPSTHLSLASRPSNMWTVTSTSNAHESWERDRNDQANIWPGALAQKAGSVDCVWNVMAHAQKPGFVFRRNGRVHLNWRGRQFSRLLAADVCTSAVVMPDNTMSRGSVESTGYPLHSPVSPSLPPLCVTVCHHISTGL